MRRRIRAPWFTSTVDEQPTFRLVCSFCSHYHVAIRGHCVPTYCNECGAKLKEIRTERYKYKLCTNPHSCMFSTLDLNRTLCPLCGHNLVDKIDTRGLW